MLFTGSFSFLKTTTILWFVLIPFGLFSQTTSPERPDLSIEPDPFSSEYFKDYYDYTKTKLIISINKKKAKNFEGDTIFKSYYSTKGFLEKRIRYAGNSPKNTTLYFYNKKGQLQIWTYKGKGADLKANYSYNKDGLISKIEQYVYKHSGGLRDSTLRSKSNYFYDDQLLKRIESNSSTIEYFKYEKERLIEKTGGYISKRFSYYPNGKLKEIREYTGGEIDNSNLRSLKKFHYNAQNQLICDSILTSANFTSKIFQITHYRYSKEGKLENFKAQFDDSFSDVTLLYQSDRIIGTKVLTNDLNHNVAYLRFPMPSGISRNSGGLLNYRDEFIYDENGNKTMKKVFVEDQLFFEIEFVLIP